MGLWLLLIVSLSARAQSAPAPAQGKPPGGIQVKDLGGGYVGNTVCRACHPAQWQTFYKNPHFKSIAAASTPALAGCEGCHGPGKNHVEAGGGKTTIPRAFSLMEPRQALDTCLNCHAKDFSRVNIRRSQHTLSDVACNNCHSIHKSPVLKFLLAKQQMELCYGCHPSVRAQFSMPFKHRLNEGFMQCSDCHNPHGTFAATWRSGMRPRMVEQASGNEEACLKCHSDKRGPFQFEHAAVRVEGCETCHIPHGSTNAKLLRRPAVFAVCLECHNGAGSFGRQADGITTQSGSHNMFDPRYQKCTICHVRIHGSNSDQRFLR